MSVLGKRNLACAEGIEKNYNNLVLATRKKFRSEQISSVGSESDENHIIFFDSFVDEPIILEGEIKVSPIKWAQAFISRDLGTIANILCSAVFTWKEVLKRERAETSSVLLNIKKLAVMRASKWMLNKEQDPWTYDPSEWATPAEYNIVTEVFETFTISIEDTGNTGPCTFYIGEEADETKEEEVGNPNESPRMNPHNNDDVDKAIERTIKRFDYSVTFTRVIQLANLGLLPEMGSSARACRELTKETIPHNTDVFVDAVQFSRNRWTEAYLSDHLVKCAEKLFRKYYRTDYQLHSRTFQSFDQFCPIKTLAIFRAAVWMRNRRMNMINTPTIYDFNPEDPTHNLFPSEEEVEQISEYINSKYAHSVVEVIGKIKRIELDSPKSEMEVGKSKPNNGKPHLKPIREIGRGVFGLVWSFLDTKFGKDYAVKRQNLEKSGRLLQYFQEFKLKERSIEHRNLVRYYDLWTDDTPSKGEHSLYVYIQMELCHSNLREWIRINNEISNSPDNLDMATQVTSGLKALHSKGIIHGNLKPTNILLAVVDSSYSWKLADFGVTRDILSKENYKNKNPDQIYSSPEMARDLTFDIKTDIYSLALIFLEAFHHFQSDVEKTELFQELKYQYTGSFFNIQALLYEIIIIECDLRLRLDDMGDCYRWLAQMLSHNPHDRPDSTEVLGYLQEHIAQRPKAKAIGQMQISTLNPQNPKDKDRMEADETLPGKI